MVTDRDNRTFLQGKQTSVFLALLNKCLDEGIFPSRRHGKLQTWGCLTKKVRIARLPSSIDQYFSFQLVARCSTNSWLTGCSTKLGHEDSCTGTNLFLIRVLLRRMHSTSCVRLSRIVRVETTTLVSSGWTSKEHLKNYGGCRSMLRLEKWDALATNSSRWKVSYQRGRSRTYHKSRP